MLHKKLVNSFLLLGVFLSNSYADSLEDSLLNGKLKVQLKSYYFTKSHVVDPKERIWVNGLDVNYISNPFLGTTTVGATVQTSNISDKDESNVQNSKFKLDMYANGAVLSELYLSPKIYETTLKLGRQFIATPLVYGSGSRMVRQSFQGATLTSKDIPESIVSLMHVDKYQARTDGGGGIGKFTKTFDYIGLIDATVRLENGANSFYLQNHSIKDLTVTYQYLNAINFAKTYFVNAVYDIGTLANLKATVQQFNTSWDMDAPTAKSGYLNLNSAMMRGYKLEGKIQDIKLSAAYSKNDSEGDILGGLGLAADSVVTAAYINGGGYLKKSSARRFAASTNIKGVNLYVGKTFYKNEDNIYRSVYGAYKYTESDYSINYDITKNLNVDFLYTKLGGYIIGTPNYDYKSRLKLTYTF